MYYEFMGMLEMNLDKKILFYALKFTLETALCVLISLRCAYTWTIFLINFCKIINPQEKMLLNPEILFFITNRLVIPVLTNIRYKQSTQVQ